MTTKKILMLHGFLPGEPGFQSKTLGIRRSMKKKGYTWNYVLVPLKKDSYQRKEENMMSKGKTEGWWVPDKQDYEMDYVLDFIRKAISVHGPFEGVVGISQDGALDKVLCSKRLEYALPGVKWTISLSDKIVPMTCEYQLPVGGPKLHVFAEPKQRLSVDVSIHQSAYREMLRKNTSDSVGTKEKGLIRTLSARFSRASFPQIKNF